MRKAERLFQLLTLLRGRRTVITARQLAQALEVSERTIYRDMQALSLSGIPIEGEAGIGYRLKPGFSVPPLMFSLSELEAILLGVRMVQRWADAELGAAGDSALHKIRAVLPDRLHFEHTIKPEWLLVPEYSQGENARFGQQLRSAIKDQLIVKITYKDQQSQQSSRNIWPLGLVFWGNVWTLVSWCELREQYRSFRLDRIASLETTDKPYDQSTGISLENYINKVT
jgi:predicted DNA-binding transcriptional regulator YafY